MWQCVRCVLLVQAACGMAMRAWGCVHVWLRGNVVAYNVFVCGGCTDYYVCLQNLMISVILLVHEDRKVSMCLSICGNYVVLPISKSDLTGLIEDCQPVIECFKPGHLKNNNLMDVLQFYGCCLLSAGTYLYHSRNTDIDKADDYYMNCSGSGFFSFNYKSDAWKFQVMNDIVLPKVFTSHASKANGYFDILPEFIASIMPCDFTGDTHYSDRGNTSKDGAAGCRFQVSALTHRSKMTHDTWKAATLANVRTVHLRLQHLGIAGWVGCDASGRMEVFYIAPLDVRLIKVVQ
jgi:hypothetical protein